MREQRLDAIKKIALDVNDPDSPNYGQFLAQEQLDGLVAPAAEDMAAVKGWLDEHHPSYHQVGVSNLVVSTTVAEASAALTTRFHKIFNLKHSQSVVRASNYYLPTNVHNAVSAVFGLHGLAANSTSEATDCTVDSAGETCIGHARCARNDLQR